MLEPDSTLRHALKQGWRGDGIHYMWMETMREFGVKQASFRIRFQFDKKLKNLVIADTSYLSHYYRYDLSITDPSTLEQIRSSGLAEALSSEILARAKVFLIEQNAEKGLEGICGRLYVNLLDDEALPILDEPGDREDCKRDGASTHERPLVQLTNKRINSHLPSRLRAAVVDEETYHKVLDLAFPRDILKQQNSDYTFVLRYEPAFLAESQITIAARNGKVEVIRYTAVDGSIEAKLNQIAQRTYRQDPKRMARQIRIQKEYVKLSPNEIKVLHESFFDRLRLLEKTRLDADKNQIIFAGDGTSYRLWYRGETELQTDFSGSNLTTATRREESPLLDWMKGVYLKVTAPSATAHR